MKRPTFSLDSLRKRMSTNRTNEKRASIHTKIQDVPIWFIVLRVFQFALSVVLLGLACLSRTHLRVHPISTDLVIFTFALTAFYHLLTSISHVRLYHSGHPQNRLGRILFLLLEFLVTVFWFVTLIFLARDARLLVGKGLYVYDDGEGSTTINKRTAFERRQYYDDYDGYDGSDGYYPDSPTDTDANDEPIGFEYFSKMALMCMDLLTGLSALEFLIFAGGFFVTLRNLHRAGLALESHARSQNLSLQSIPSIEDTFHDSKGIQMNATQMTTLPPVYEPSLHPSINSPSLNTPMGHETYPTPPTSSSYNNSDAEQNTWSGMRSENGKDSRDTSMSQGRKVKNVVDRMGREKGEFGRGPENRI